MKSDAQILLQKALGSLILSIDHFNQSSDSGRPEAVLILLNHSLEMLLKASLIERGTKIKEKDERNTIGYDRCIRKGLTEGGVKFLNENQGISLRFIYGLRNAAEHYFIDVSESLLYIATQSGFTQFRVILKDVFGQDLADYFPERVFPVSTVHLVDIAQLFHDEIKAIRALLHSSKHNSVETLARLRALSIMEEAIKGESQIPSDEDLEIIGNKIEDGEEWSKIFPGVASINVTPDESNPSLGITITKKEGIPFERVPKGTPDAGLITIKHVNDLDFYSMNLTKLREKLGLNQPQALALVWYFKIRDNKDYYKEFKFGATVKKRYSPKALDKLKKELGHINFEDVYEQYKNRNKKVK